MIMNELFESQIRNIEKKSNKNITKNKYIEIFTKQKIKWEIRKIRVSTNRVYTIYTIFGKSNKIKLKKEGL